MNADGGLVLMILGALALVTSLAGRVVVQHRWIRTPVETAIDPALRAAFPPPPAARDLERLAIEAEAVLESQELCRHRQRRSRRQT
jgi:hypothetical protein